VGIKTFIKDALQQEQQRQQGKQKQKYKQKAKLVPFTGLGLCEALLATVSTDPGDLQRWSAQVGVCLHTARNGKGKGSDLQGVEGVCV
jgi:hypothetical protein